jgi:hypothetical protein
MMELDSQMTTHFDAYNLYIKNMSFNFLVQEVLNATAANSRIMTENEQTNEI